MAKIAFGKIISIKTIEDKIITINDEQILVKQYLPIGEKAKMIERILSAVFDENGFASPVRINIYFTIELVKNYSNINITDKMIETAEKTYDMLIINQIDQQIKDAIPENELNQLWNCVYDCIDRVEKYNSSFVGMIKTITQDYDATKINVDEIMSTLDQPDKIGMIKDILDKIG